MSPRTAPIRASARCTCTADHSPPRAVGTSAEFRSAASCPKDAAPLARGSAMIVRAPLVGGRNGPRAPSTTSTAVANGMCAARGIESRRQPVGDRGEEGVRRDAPREGEGAAAPRQEVPRTGKTRSLNEIGAELAALGYTAAKGKQFSAEQVKRLVGRT